MHARRNFSFAELHFSCAPDFYVRFSASVSCASFFYLIYFFNLDVNDTCVEENLHINLITEHRFFAGNAQRCSAVILPSEACCFFSFTEEEKMPENQIQRMIFALITVVITVHAYVFFSLYVVNGSLLMQVSGQDSVLGAIRALGGVELLGRRVPVWGIVAVEFCFAYLLECVMGSPMSFRLAARVFNPCETHPVIFETAVICATAALMCPSMSLIAAVLYYPYSCHSFNVLTLLANWLRLVCFNFPFAFFTQLFFIQPFVRTVFRLIFARRA